MGGSTRNRPPTIQNETDEAFVNNRLPFAIGVSLNFLRRFLRGGFATSHLPKFGVRWSALPNPLLPSLRAFFSKP